MDAFRANTLRDLADAQDRECVSLFMPILRGEEVGQQNAIRLKNLLAPVQDRLVECGWRTTVARDFAQAIHEQAEKVDYWGDGSHGLAVFGSERRIEMYRLPIQMPEFWSVGDHFHITPLTTSADGGEFFILAVSQKSCRVLRGDRWHVEEVSVPGLPASMADALGPMEPVFAHEAHGAGRHGDQRATVFTGQGGEADYLKADIEAYFRAIDRALTKYLGTGERPLVFAGVRSLLPTYQSVSRYAGLETQSIDGNPELVSDHELHRRAWAIVEPRFQTEQLQVLRMCKGGDGNCSDELRSTSDLVRGPSGTRREPRGGTEYLLLGKIRRDDRRVQPGRGTCQRSGRPAEPGRGRNHPPWRRCVRGGLGAGRDKRVGCSRAAL